MTQLSPRTHLIGLFRLPYWSEPHGQEQRPPANSQRGTEALSPRTHKEPNPVHTTKGTWKWILEMTGAPLMS